MGAKLELEIEVLERRDELAALREAWSALWERCPEATSFQRPEWVLPWCYALGSDDVLAIACRSEGRLVGLAPLSIRRAGEERVVSPLGAGLTDYNDVLAAPGAERAVAEAVLSCLGERAAGWDVVDFEELRPGSPMLSADAPAGWADEVAVQAVCPALELPASGAVEDAVPVGLRAKLRKARRRLERAGDLRLELTDAERVDEHLDALFEMHRDRWRERGCDGVLPASLRGFHGAVARGMLARGALRLFVLRLGPRIIAGLYALADRGTIACYITGFDPALAYFSPGLVLLGGVIEHALREGARTLDFLRGREAYKYLWGPVDRPSYRRTLRRGAGAPARDEAESALDGVVSGALSPEVGLARLLAASGDLRRAERAIAELTPPPGEATARLEALRRCVEGRRPACAAVAEMLRAHADAAGAAGPAPARYARLFDELVGRSEEASVAAYSLGDRGILERATSEVVALLDRWGSLAPGHAVLEIGCGIGRFEAALAGRVREAWGLDVSPGMIEAARRRCAGLENVRLAVSSGTDLAGVPPSAFDLVVAIDAFPYIVDAGPEVVDAHFAEARRVLRPGGELAIFNYSYRGEPRRDAADVMRLGARHGFEVIVNGTRALRLWDGLAYRLLKRAGRGGVAEQGSR